MEVKDLFLSIPSYTNDGHPPFSQPSNTTTLRNSDHNLDFENDIDTNFDIGELLNSQDHPSLSSNINGATSSSSPPPINVEHDQACCHACGKRRRTDEGNANEATALEPTQLACEPPPALLYNAGQQTNGEASLSPQSIAARDRRRKIAAKTQQLGRMIPGGAKMSQADMFQSAAKYVLFLQAQIAALQHAAIRQRVNPTYSPEDLANLLGSLSVQQKLYVKGVCLVPKDALEILALELNVPCKTPIVDHIKRILKFDSRH